MGISLVHLYRNTLLKNVNMMIVNALAPDIDNHHVDFIVATVWHRLVIHNTNIAVQPLNKLQYVRERWGPSSFQSHYYRRVRFLVAIKIICCCFTFINAQYVFVIKAYIIAGTKSVVVMQYAFIGIITVSRDK